MNVSLSEDLVQFVSEQTQAGGYTSQSEVVREGLRLLRSRLDKRRALERALEAGLAAKDAGRVKPFTAKLLREIAARGREQVAARRARGKP